MILTLLSLLACVPTAKEIDACNEAIDAKALEMGATVALCEDDQWPSYGWPSCIACTYDDCYLLECMNGDITVSEAETYDSGP